MRWSSLVLVGLCFSCGAAQVGSDAGPDSGVAAGGFEPFDAGWVACAGFDEASCIDAGCRALTGYESKGPDAGSTSGLRAYAGCRYTAGILPGTILTCAHGRDGVCWLFPDSDVPGDFVKVGCNTEAPDFCPRF